MFSKKSKQLKARLERAESYEEWLKYATEQDKATGMVDWKETEQSELYDNEQIKLRLEKLQDARGDAEALLFLLNEGIHGNMGGMGNPKLHHKALSGTKQLIIGRCIRSKAEIKTVR